MARAAREVPPPLELLCLSAIWSLGEGSVRDVRQAVAVTRPLAYTTIMTVLERLARKGRLSRRKVGRAFHYAPTASRDAMRGLAVKELVDAFFDGDAGELLSYLQGTGAAPSSASVEDDVRLDTALL